MFVYFENLVTGKKENVKASRIFEIVGSNKRKPFSSETYDVGNKYAYLAGDKLERGVVYTYADTEEKLNNKVHNGKKDGTRQFRKPKRHSHGPVSYDVKGFLVEEEKMAVHEEKANQSSLKRAKGEENASSLRKKMKNDKDKTNTIVFDVKNLEKDNKDICPVPVAASAKKAATNKKIKKTTEINKKLKTNESAKNNLKIIQGYRNNGLALSKNGTKSKEEDNTDEESCSDKNEDESSNSEDRNDSDNGDDSNEENEKSGKDGHSGCAQMNPDNIQQQTIKEDTFEGSSKLDEEKFSDSDIDIVQEQKDQHEGETHRGYAEEEKNEEECDISGEAHEANALEEKIRCCDPVCRMQKRMLAYQVKNFEDKNLKVEETLLKNQEQIARNLSDLKHLFEMRLVPSFKPAVCKLKDLTDVSGDSDKCVVPEGMVHIGDNKFISKTDIAKVEKSQSGLRPRLLGLAKLYWPEEEHKTYAFRLNAQKGNKIPDGTVESMTGILNAMKWNSALKCDYDHVKRELGKALSEDK